MNVGWNVTNTNDTHEVERVMMTSKIWSKSSKTETQQPQNFLTTKMCHRDQNNKNEI